MGDVKKVRKAYNMIMAVKINIDDTIMIIGNVHLPCRWYEEESMEIYAAQSMEFMHRTAKRNKFILCGDFNISPNSKAYKLMVQGGSIYNHNYPGLYSSALLVNGEEPEATSHTQKVNNKEFKGCLDYIFSSNNNIVDFYYNYSGIMPNDYEPSDHIELTAEFDTQL